jgi:hypothetical protein
VTRHRLLILLVAIGVAASTFQGIAWAHPGHEPADESAFATTMRLAPGERERTPGSPALPAAHAALHLRHLPHADSLAIGASATHQAVADLYSAVPTATPLAPLEEAWQRNVAPATDTTVSATQGRAPPFFPA